MVFIAQPTLNAFDTATRFHVSAVVASYSHSNCHCLCRSAYISIAIVFTYVYDVKQITFIIIFFFFCQFLLVFFSPVRLFRFRKYVNHKHKNTNYIATNKYFSLSRKFGV